MQYTKRHTSYISYDKIGKDNIYNIRTTLAFLYSDMDGGIADGIAIEKGNTVYIVDSGNDNGNIDFGVREILKIEDNEYKNKIVENINERAISKGYVSIELLGKIRRSPSNDRSGGVGRELSKELSTDNRQPTHNKGRVSDSNADRGIRGLTNQSKLTSNQKPTQNEAIKAGETKAGVALIDLADPFESFFAEHKGFLKHLDDKIIVADKTFTVNQAMALCKTSEREQAHFL